MRRFAPLLLGVALVAAGSLVGLDPAIANAVFHGPIALRAVLTGIAAILGLWLLFSAVARLAGDDDAAPRSFAEMIRAVRLVFLAIAAFAAASAFLVGDLLPLVVGFVIAGVDVAETALLLLVAGTHQRVEPPG